MADVRSNPVRPSPAPPARWHDYCRPGIFRSAAASSGCSPDTDNPCSSIEAHTEHLDVLRFAEREVPRIVGTQHCSHHRVIGV